MDTALIVITLISLGLTSALLVYAARLQREQRDREDARVSALADELRFDPDPNRQSRAMSEHEDFHASPADERSATVAVRFDTAAGLPSTLSRRLLAPAAGSLVVAFVLGSVYVLDDGPRPAGVDGAPASVATTLELVALDQARSGRGLAVRGVVRNPGGSEPRRGVDAVVFALDRDGRVVGSARAAIDYQVLEAGDESPFTVTVPDAAGASRYRVSFRANRDVLPHVDRRTRPGGREG